MVKITEENGNGTPKRHAGRHRMRPIEEYSSDEENSRLLIPKDLVPDGFSLQWVTHKVYGQPQPQHRASFERKGWEPVHQEDFEGRFRGMFLPASYEGEIEVDGLVLMARPKEWSEKAAELDKRRAAERVFAKESQLRSGQLDGVTLDTQHPSARNATTVNRYMEPIKVPDK